MRRQTAAGRGRDVAGIAVLGLATEVAKLSEGERRTLIDWTAEDMAGRKPFGVTVDIERFQPHEAAVEHPPLRSRPRLPVAQVFQHGHSFG